jgi:ribosomal protein S18 acetylase RimI-like enzyme
MKIINYRIATVSDVPALIGIRNSGESGGASFERMTKYLEGTHYPQLALQPRIMWIAEDSETVAGYIAGHLSHRFGCEGELQWIYIVTHWRGSYLSSELLRLLAKWFVDQNAFRICVDVGNEQARRFYMKNGAKVLNEHWLIWEDISSIL